MELRGYQQAGVDALRKHYASGLEKLLYVLPTGGGKTFVFCYIANQAVARGNNVLILVHRKELLLQASRSLSELGVKHGLIAPGHTPTKHPVQVASVQTIVRRMHHMKWPPGLIVVDEAHHLTAGSLWGKVIEYYDGVPVLGVTATPERLDGQGLGDHAGGFFQEMVLGPTIGELIEMGNLVRPVVYSSPIEVDLTGVRKTAGGDYNAKQLGGAVDKPRITGSAVDHYRKYLGGAPAIAFCASVAHAEHVAAQFRAAGYQAVSLDGNVPDGERKRRIADLGTGRLNLITSCDIISEGTDIPIVAGAILLRPTASLSLYLQQVGRALRPYNGKKEAIILDHVGNSGSMENGVFVPKHGLPDEDRDWSIDGRAKGKRAKDDDQQINVRQCEQCYRVHKPAPCCPHCGYSYPVQAREIEEVDGQLEQITPEMVKRERKKEQGKAKSYDDLLKIARERGYKPGWARYVAKSRGIPVPVKSEVEAA
ncbi:MAG: DEAD/DEAH box helicase [Gammaproteobacteria bacterium]|nr:DEAD/DEAH box helicase [Gammaproteobacteria bacterium]